MSEKRECDLDAGWHYNFAGAERCVCGMFVRHAHVVRTGARVASAAARRIEVLEAALKKAMTRVPLPEWEKLQDVLALIPEVKKKT